MREGLRELGRGRIGLGKARRKAQTEKKQNAKDAAAPGNRPGFMAAMIRRSSLKGLRESARKANENRFKQTPGGE